jgi:hypothetical protein
MRQLLWHSPSVRRTGRGLAPRLRRIVVVLVVLAGIVLAFDRIGAYAASRAADSQARQQGAGAVNVRILGFPFLTQVVRGRYDKITVSEGRISGSGLTLDNLYATARGVHLPFSAVVHGRVDAVPIDEVDGSAVLTYAVLTNSITRSLGLRSDLRLSITAHGTNQVVAHLTGPLDLSVSQTLPVPTVRDGKLQLGAFVEKYASFVPDSVTQDLAVSLPTLPYGLQLGNATARPDGIHFTVSGTHLTVKQ